LDGVIVFALNSFDVISGKTNFLGRIIFSLLLLETQNQDEVFEAIGALQTTQDVNRMQ
jgi:hypothetical protein